MIKLRILQGDPIIHDVRGVTMPGRYRGLPEIGKTPCADGCHFCADACPVRAIETDPVRIDLGKCTFCPACAAACPEKKIRFTGDYRLGTNVRDELVVDAEKERIRPEKASAIIKRVFGKSLKLRQVSAGGCNGCELELNALSNVNFDLGRYGIEFTASPRHADGIVITGPLSSNMSDALEICYDAVPAPKIVILTGACAISGGVFSGSDEINRDFIAKHKIDLYVPGCPPHPLTFITAIIDWLGK
ncbi:MAG TPA: 4Fe-4S dicluster domain-containing protein [Spirochaetota bacterium]|nr:4Fe-4S dicluster domain-containing protein [Spirochaetota bacterium]